MSEKFDGVRGYWTGKKLIFRSGNPIHVPKWFTKNFPSTPLDGELWIGRQRFSELVSIVRTESSDTGWHKVHYLIFDVPEKEGGFENRIDFAHQWFGQHPSGNVKIVPQEMCTSKEYLLKRLKEIGIPFHEPKGAFYIFPKIADYGLDDVSFCEKLLKDEKLAIVPGSAFGGKGIGHVRMTYAESLENLEEAFSRLERFWKKKK